MGEGGLDGAVSTAERLAALAPARRELRPGPRQRARSGSCKGTSTMLPCALGRRLRCTRPCCCCSAGAQHGGRAAGAQVAQPGGQPGGQPGSRGDQEVAGQVDEVLRRRQQHHIHNAHKRLVHHCRDGCEGWGARLGARCWGPGGGRSLSGVVVGAAQGRTVAAERVPPLGPSIAGYCWEGA